MKYKVSYMEIIYAFLILGFISIELLGKSSIIYLGLFALMAFGVFFKEWISGKKKIIINKMNLVWLLFPISIVIAMRLTDIHWLRPSLMFLFICIIMIVKCNIYSIGDFEKAIVDVSLVIAVSVFLEWLFTDLFINYIYVWYPASQKWVLLNQANARAYYSGIMSNVQEAALLLSTGAIVCLVRNRKISFLVLVSALLLTGKRAGLFVFIILMLVYILFIRDKQDGTDKKRIKRKYVLLTAGVILVISIVLLVLLKTNRIDMGTIKRFFVFKDFIGMYQSGVGFNYIMDKILAGRWTTYKQSWQFFMENPIRGIGWGNFSLMNYNPYLGESVVNVHNIYLKLLCETGLIGFLSFIIPAIKSIKYTWSKIKTSENKKIFQIAVLIQLQFLLLGMMEIALDNILTFTVYFVSIFIASNIGKKA